MAIRVTDKALERIQALKKKRQTPNHVLRLGVKGGGCSGLTYTMDLVETPEKKDKIFEFDPDIVVAVDRKSYLFLNGTILDFEVEMMRRGFVFNNPLAQTSCSCGESFGI